MTSDPETGQSSRLAQSPVLRSRWIGKLTPGYYQSGRGSALQRRLGAQRGSFPGDAATIPVTRVVGGATVYIRAAYWFFRRKARIAILSLAIYAALC